MPDSAASDIRVARAYAETFAGLGVCATHLSIKRPEVHDQLRAVLDRLVARPGPHLLIGDLNLGPEDVARYRAEPYVVAADVYSAAGHTGRGGWTWYTGAAGWMYRVGVEGLLGLSLRSGALHIEPCIPASWPGYEAVVRTLHGELRVTVENPEGVTRGVRHIELDGTVVDGDIPLAGMSGTHTLRVVLAP